MDILEKLKSQIGDDVQYILDHQALFKLAVAEIEALREALANAAPKVKPLDFPERRNGYWGNKDGYQVARTNGDLFRVRLHGRVICRDIRGFDRAVKWANEHHSRRILSMLEGE